MYMGMFMMFFVFLGGLIFIGLIAAAVYLVVRSSRTTPTRQETRTDARRILDERLARGEITSEEYDTLRAKLE